MSDASSATAAAGGALSGDAARHCYLDLDVDGHRGRLRRGAAFVFGTDARYGLSSGDLRRLGGSEVRRLPEYLASDREWGGEPAAFHPPSPGGNARIVLELFWEAAPVACRNFALLCSNPSTVRGEASGKPLTYKGSKVHRVVPGFVLQGGDIVFGNGTGGESAVLGGGKKFKDERGGLALKHDARGVLSMGNSGKNSNTSQFFVTLAAAPQCDGRHVVFGRVVSGFDVLEEAERHGAAGGDGAPRVPIAITDCGLWHPLLMPGAGHWYDKPDPDA
jgi:cyclophilin family peptidyl-prolyl cis-trans isomerase